MQHLQHVHLHFRTHTPRIPGAPRESAVYLLADRVLRPPAQRWCRLGGLHGDRPGSAALDPFKLGMTICCRKGSFSLDMVHVRVFSLHMMYGQTRRRPKVRRYVYGRAITVDTKRFRQRMCAILWSVLAHVRQHGEHPEPHPEAPSTSSVRSYRSIHRRIRN